MRYIFVILILAVLNTTNGVAQYFKPTKTQQIAKFDKIAHDFGEINKGANGTVTFFFTNISPKPAKIDEVKPGCSCSSAKYTQDEIQPNERGFVTIVYDTNIVGEFSKMSTVTIGGQTYTLSIRGNVKPPIQKN
jgi:hypothetical protein